MNIEACVDSNFKGIVCLETNDKFGFFRDLYSDCRPSSAVWVEKEDAELLFKLFTPGD